MRLNRNTLLAIVLCVVTGSPFARAQETRPTILQIDVENMVRYVADTPDPSKFATNPGITPAIVPRNFGAYIGLADIVAVNGLPAKGTYASRGLVFLFQKTNISRWWNTACAPALVVNPRRPLRCAAIAQQQLNPSGREKPCSAREVCLS
jgi:hypothetical protein